MVLVAVSTTLSLYIGLEDFLKTRYPYDISVDYFNTDINNAQSNEIFESATNTVKNEGHTVSSVRSYTCFSFLADRDGNSLTPQKQNNYNSNACNIIVMPETEYKNVTGKDLSLSRNGIAFYSTGASLKDFIILSDKKYEIQQTLKTAPFVGNYAVMTLDTYFIIVQDDSSFEDISKAVNAISPHYYDFHIALNTDGTDQQKMDCLSPISSAVAKINPDATISVECKQAEKSDYYEIYGSLFFLGIFLGVLFLRLRVSNYH